MKRISIHLGALLTALVLLLAGTASADAWINLATSLRVNMTVFVAALSGCAFLVAGGLFLAVEEKIQADFRALNLSPKIVRRVYLPGKDDQQKNLTFGYDDPLPESMMNRVSADSILSQSDFIAKLYRGNGQALRFQTGELQHAVSAKTRADERTDALRVFAASSLTKKAN